MNREAQQQRRYIEGLVGQLKQLQERIAAAPGRLAVLDTNVLLHYEPPSKVNWRAVLSAEAVRLVLPLRVVEELDEKKYAGRSDLADRARRLLSGLWALLEPTKGAPVPLADGVTIELPVDSEPRRRTLDADEEILAEGTSLAAAGAPVTVVTGDTGMSLRAVARGLTVARMPDQYLRIRPSSADGTQPAI